MSNFEYAQATDDQLLDWALTAYEAQRDADQWDREMRQVSWAERGGYAAGLPRPAF